MFDLNASYFQLLGFLERFQMLWSWLASVDRVFYPVKWYKLCVFSTVLALLMTVTWASNRYRSAAWRAAQVNRSASALQRGPGELQGLHADVGSLPAHRGQREEQERPHQRAAQQQDQQAALWVSSRSISTGRPESAVTYMYVLFVQLLSVCMTWTEMTRSPGTSCCRWADPLVEYWVTKKFLPALVKSGRCLLFC